MATRFDAEELRQFGTAVLMAHGLEQRHAKVTADVLVEADLLGYRTHGLDLLAGYVESLQRGEMLHTGEPEVVHDAAPRAT